MTMNEWWLEHGWSITATHPDGTEEFFNMGGPSPGNFSDYDILRLMKAKWMDREHEAGLQMDVVIRKDGVVLFEGRYVR